MNVPVTASLAAERDAGSSSSELAPVPLGTELGWGLGDPSGLARHTHIELFRCPSCPRSPAVRPFPREGPHVCRGTVKGAFALAAGG